MSTDASAADIATALTELLAGSTVRREAGRFADKIAQLGGGNRATEKIITLHRHAKVDPHGPETHKPWGRHWPETCAP